MIPEIIKITSNEPPLFYPYSVKIDKCSDSCNNIIDPYAKLCFSDVVKNINAKVFNLMSRTNETRYIEWHETVNVDQMQVLVIINKDGITINADVHVKV